MDRHIKINIWILKCSQISSNGIKQHMFLKPHFEIMYLDTVPFFDENFVASLKQIGVSLSAVVIQI